MAPSEGSFHDATVGDVVDSGKLTSDPDPGQVEHCQDLGWAIGDGREYAEDQQDARDAEALYSILEQEVVPEFYARDAAGMPRQWLERVRRSMAELAPVYSSSRMAGDYVEQYYLSGAAELRRRMGNGGEPAREMRRWETRLHRYWPNLHIGKTTVSCDGAAWSFSVPVNLGEIAPGEIAVQLYAEGRDGEAPFVSELSSIPSNAGTYTGSAPASRPPAEYTVRIIPRRTGAAVPTELSLILWQN